MQKQKTRLTSLILAIFMVLGVFSTFPSLRANAETAEPLATSGQCGDNAFWEFDGETLYITGEGDMWDYTTEIYVVLEDGRHFSPTNVTPWLYLYPKYLKMSEGITSIGSFAFADLPLIAAFIPDSVTFIDDTAFWNSHHPPTAAPSNLNIPVVIVCNEGSYAKESPDGFRRITEEVEVDGNAFFSKDGKKFIYYNSQIDNMLYDISEINNTPYYPEHSGYYIIPDGVEEISENAFAESSLAYIEIPETIKTISPKAFSDCDVLKYLYNPLNNNSEVCENEVKNEKLILQDDVLFTNDFSVLVKYSPAKQTEEYIIPDTVKAIDKWAFYQNKNIKSVVIPESITSIEISAFDYCDNLTIYGYYGSYAETYANENDIPFVNLNNIPTKLSATVKKVSPTSTKVYVERTQGESKGAISYVLLKGDYSDIDFSNMKLADMKNHPDFVKAEYSNYTKNFNFNITNLDRNTVYTVVPFTVKMKYGYFGLGENVVFTTSDISLTTVIKTVTANIAKFKISRSGEANGALGYVLLKGDVADNFTTLEEYQNSDNFLANQTSNWTGSVTVTVKGIESGETYTVVPYTQKGNVYTFGLGENITFIAEYS
jgi:hypothetical protein